MRPVFTSKPSLKALLKGKGKSYIIAVASVSTGAGATHVSLAVANFLRRKGLKVALCEMDGKGDIHAIEEVFEGRATERIGSFRIKGVDYHKAMVKGGLMKVIHQDYHVVILDIGASLSRHMEDFQRADKSIMVSRVNDWKLRDRHRLLDAYGHLLPKETSWLLVHGGHRDARIFRRQYGFKAYGVSLTMDPFMKDKSTDQQLTKLFE